MKAVVKYGFGPRETELRDVPIPEIGDDDLLIEVKAAGVCGSGPDAPRLSKSFVGARLVLAGTTSPPEPRRASSS